MRHAKTEEGRSYNTRNSANGCMDDVKKDRQKRRAPTVRRNKKTQGRKERPKHGNMGEILLTHTRKLIRVLLSKKKPRKGRRKNKKRRKIVDPNLTWREGCGKRARNMLL